MIHIKYHLVQCLPYKGKVFFLCSALSDSYFTESENSLNDKLNN